MSRQLTRAQMAWRLAQDIPNGAYVNLGIGMPEIVANYLPRDREVVFHCENGVLGMGPMPAPGKEDYELISAGKRPVTMVAGGAFVHSADSFAMIRGGHIDICVLGAFQVSVKGDLANWSTGEPDAVPAVGGAMDLAVGAKRVFVISEHCTKRGAPKIVERCGYPLTAVGVVSTIYTDLAVIDVTADGLLVRELIEGLDFAELQQRTGAPLSLASDWHALTAPTLA
jgi:3-oxoadipate CoA-transferase, beta subunit